MKLKVSTFSSPSSYHSRSISSALMPLLFDKIVKHSSGVMTPSSTATKIVLLFLHFPPYSYDGLAINGRLLQR